ncbi:MAG: GntR family transcriptional regulator [Desulfatiglandaceae bacterium]
MITKAVEFDFKNLGTVPARRSLGEYVYQNLKQAIVLGEMAPGSRVVENRVADAMKISRTPVREAIHKLEREGFLKRSSSGGLSVSGLTRAEIREVFEIRSVLESYAARLAAARHHGEDLAPLEDKIREFDVTLEQGRLEALPEINTDFHDMLYELSRSPKLVEIINDLRDQIQRFRIIILKKQGWAGRSNEDHKLIINFMKKRDEEGIVRIMREHMLRGQNIVLQEFDWENG